MPSVEHRSRRRAVALASGLAVAAIAGGLLTTPLSASATSYPTWAEVQAAKGNAAAKKKQTQIITADLAGLEKTAAARSQAALTADAANAAAQQQYQAASSQAASLAVQVSAQRKKVDEAQTQAGQLAARLYRMGSSQSLDGSLFSGSKADSTLYKLGALSQLSSQWQTVLSGATVASKSLSSLSAQASVAATERDRLAGVAAAKLSAAKSAQATADAAVTSATAQQNTLYAQLASLNGTTAKLEKGYQQGVAAAKAYAAAQAAKAAKEKALALANAEKLRKQQEAAQAQQPTTTAPFTPASTGTTTTTSLGSGVVDDTAGAHAYAQSQLAARGWSGDYQCLVNLWNQESGWRTSALNVSSGAYGIPQALPADKMATAGLDWQTSYVTQINWGLGYIAAAYGTPCGAWAHEVAHNWY